MKRRKPLLTLFLLCTGRRCARIVLMRLTCILTLVLLLVNVTIIRRVLTLMLLRLLVTVVLNRVKATGRLARKRPWRVVCRRRRIVFRFRWHWCRLTHCRRTRVVRIVAIGLIGVVHPVSRGLFSYWCWGSRALITIFRRLRW